MIIIKKSVKKGKETWVVYRNSDYGNKVFGRFKLYLTAVSQANKHKKPDEEIKVI